jgi:predicted nucleotidyltransferase
LLPQLSQAFVYGSVATGKDHAGSDVDVMLVGEDIIYSDVMQRLETAEHQLGRSVNPTIYSPAEFATRLAEGQNFLTRVMSQAQINLLSERVAEPKSQERHERTG